MSLWKIGTRCRDTTTISTIMVLVMVTLLAAQVSWAVPPQRGSTAAPSQQNAPVAVPQWITPLRATPCVLEDRAYSEEVRVPFMVKDATTSTSDLKVSLLSVTTNNIESTWLRSHFMPVRFDPTSAKSGSLVVPVRLTYPTPASPKAGSSGPTVTPQDLPQGTYALVVVVTNTKARQRGDQLISLRIVRNPVQVRLPAKLVVEQVQPWAALSSLLHPSLNPTSYQNYNFFDVYEVSGRSRLTGISAKIREDGQGAAHVTGYGMELLSPNNAAPGKGARVFYDLTGPFPLGSTTGTLEVRTPQMANAVTMPFEVRARWSRWSILLIVAMGMGLGWGVRHWLQDRLAWNDAVLHATDLYGRVRRARQRFQEENFDTATTAITEVLNDALKKYPPDVDGLNQVIKTQGEAFDAAMTHLDARNTEITQLLAQYVKAAAPMMTLPKPLALALTRFRDRVSNAAVALRGGGLTVSRRELAAAHQDVVSAVNDYIGVWQPLAQEAHSSFIQSGPVQAVAAAKDRTEALNQALAAVVTLAPDAALDDVTATLENIRKARETLSYLASRLPQWARDTVADVALSLQMPTTTPPLHDLLEQIESSVREAQERSGEDKPEQFLLAFTHSLNRLQSSWEAVFEGYRTAHGIAEEKWGEVKTLVDQHDYAKAALQANALKPQPQEELNKGIEGINLLRASGSETLLSLQFNRMLTTLRPTGTQPRFPLTDLGHWPIPLIGNVAPADAIEVQGQRAMLSYERTKFWQMLLVACGLTIFGFIIFAGKFTGTLADFAEVFSWAFALDVSVQSVVQVAQNARTPASNTPVSSTQTSSTPTSGGTPAAAVPPGGAS